MDEDRKIMNGEINHILPKNGGSSFGKCGWCALIFIEPVFILYQMTYWAFIPLNDQFVVSYVTDRIYQDVQTESNQLYGNSMLGQLTKRNIVDVGNYDGNSASSAAGLITNNSGNTYKQEWTSAHSGNNSIRESVYYHEDTDNGDTSVPANTDATGSHGLVGVSDDISAQGGNYNHAYYTNISMEDTNTTDQDVISDLDNYVQEESARWVLILNFIKDILAIASTLVICSYTDIVGRKLGLIIPLVGFLCCHCMYILTIYLELPIQYLIIGSIVDGLSGSSLTVTGSSFAYLADVVPKEKRSFRFTVLHASMFGSASVISIAVGYMIDGVGYLVTLWCLVVVLVLGILYTVLLLKDSKPMYSDDKERGIKAIIKKTASSFSLWCKKRDAPNVTAVLLLALSALLCSALVIYGRIDVDTLFLVGEPFSLDSVGVGDWMGVKTLLILIAELAGVWLLTPRIFDATICILSGLSGFFGNIMQGLSINIGMAYGSCVIQMGEATMVPLIRAMMSKSLEPYEQGALQAALGATEAVCELFSTILLQSIYYATVTTFRGTVFMVMGTLYLCAAIFMSVVLYLKKHSTAQSN